MTIEHLLLLTDIQEWYARSKSFNLRFPVKAILPWFNQQSIGCLASTGLPPNLFDDNTWLGVDVYAVLSSRSSGLLNNLKTESPPLIVVRFHGSKGSFSAGAPLDLHTFLGCEPYQLVLLHVPRVRFSRQIFNQSRHIWSVFEVTIPGQVAIDICGIRLVYEQDLNRLIDTITECTLGTPDVLHPGYYRDFSRFISEEEVEFRAG